MLSGLTMDHGRFVAALWAIRDKRPLSGFVLFLLSILPKWQPLIIAPSCWRIRWKFRTFARYAARWSIRDMETGHCLAGDGLMRWRGIRRRAVGSVPLVLLHPFLSGDTLNIPGNDVRGAHALPDKSHRTHSRIDLSVILALIHVTICSCCFATHGQFVP